MSELWEAFCADSDPYLQYISAQTFNYSINISLQHKYIFVETPKVACSSIKLSLQRLEIGDPHFSWHKFMDVHNRDFSPLLKPSQVCGFDKLIAREDFSVFCFVRNPYSRLLSCYLDKIVGNRPPKKQILIEMGIDPIDIETEVSFQQFVEMISQQDIIKMNPHWRPQYYQTCQGVIQYDAIGKFESFPQDFSQILSQISPNFTDYFSNERRHQTFADSLLEKYYTTRLRDLVAELYAVDFQHFDYDVNLGR